MNGFTLWFTGLPSAGKSTLARGVARALLARGARVEVLDGDEAREHLGQGLGFSRADRDTHVRRVGFVASLLSRNGVVAIAALISPYRAARAEVRQGIERFVEIYVDCPMDIVRARDVKGLYRKALAGEIHHFTGVDDPYEPPLAPDVTVHTNEQSVDESIERILAAIESFGYLPPADDRSADRCCRPV